MWTLIILFYGRFGAAFTSVPGFHAEESCKKAAEHFATTKEFRQDYFTFCIPVN